ncbi:MAG: ImmA/IrrE family metallo-endopeptidase [Chloroflexi bacterium]|nr:MAG: ImmA/IrrE family metallo-endopeptidase [Chloroflexota bacterium]
METNILDTIDMRELGKELQQARIKRGLTQEEAAKIIEVARTTITAIEKGERRIKADELIKLARAYGRQVSDFVRPRPKIEPFQPQFRGPVLRSAEDEAKIAQFVTLLEELSRNYLELEQIESAPLVHKYPTEYDISGLRPEQAAENVAIEERNRLGLGDGPIPILRDILEQDVGLRIFYLELKPSKFSAIYLYDSQLGGCIAVNSLHPEERRRWSLAHDYGHFLVHRYKPVVFVEDSYQRLPESERFADYFALYFLMPTGGLKRRFNDIRRTKEKITPADLCTLAHYYGVSVAAITLRLEDLKLLPTGSWDKLRERGLKVREAQQQLGLGAIPERNEKLPMRYQYLAVDAFDQGLITEGQFARFLEVDRVEARHIAEILRQHTSDVTDDSPIDLDMTQSLGA